MINMYPPHLQRDLVGGLNHLAHAGATEHFAQHLVKRFFEDGLVNGNGSGDFARRLHLRFTLRQRGHDGIRQHVLDGR